jgi:hypothetical protein
VVRRGRLRWFGHLERKSESDSVSACRYLDVGGDKQKGRCRKTWGECVKNDLRALHVDCWRAVCHAAIQRGKSR